MVKNVNLVKRNQTVLKILGNQVSFIKVQHI